MVRTAVDIETRNLSQQIYKNFKASLLLTIISVPRRIGLPATALVLSSTDEQMVSVHHGRAVFLKGERFDERRIGEILCSIHVGIIRSR